MERLFPGGRVAPRLPLVQAPMAGSQTFRLAASVVKAGCVGSIPCAMLSPSLIRHNVSEFQKHRGSLEHLNLNFFAHQTPPLTETSVTEGLRRWSELLAPFRLREGLPPATATSWGTVPSSRRPFDKEMAELVEELRPGIVSFHFGLPENSLLEKIRRTGCLIWSTATTVEEALYLERSGFVDAVILQGLEAGGHRGHFMGTPEDRMRTRGQAPLLSLLRSARAAVHASLPIIAAGGVADAADAREALACGADAVQVGTAFLLCPESDTSDVHRSAIIAASERRETATNCEASADGTQLTNLFSGGLARGLTNVLMRELGPVSPEAPPFPLASSALADLRIVAERDGRGDYSPLWAGQRYAQCLPSSSAEEVCRRMFPKPWTHAE